VLERRTGAILGGKETRNWERAKRGADVCEKTELQLADQKSLIGSGDYLALVTGLPPFRLVIGLTTYRKDSSDPFCSFRSQTPCMVPRIWQYHAVVRQRETLFRASRSLIGPVNEAGICYRRPPLSASGFALGSSPKGRSSL
jgi:hypothetical protein